MLDEITHDHQCWQFHRPSSTLTMVVDHGFRAMPPRKLFPREEEQLSDAIVSFKLLQRPDQSSIEYKRAASLPDGALAVLAMSSSHATLVGLFSSTSVSSSRTAPPPSSISIDTMISLEIDGILFASAIIFAVIMLPRRRRFQRQGLSRANEFRHTVEVKALH
nr:hypothetical protein CFP56_11798 [Quercus suber]